jgi:two-component system, NtrC family, sensor histidine kinase PilS
VPAAGVAPPGSLFFNAQAKLFYVHCLEVMTRTALHRNVRRLIAIRVVISTLLLGSATFAQVSVPGFLPVDPFFFLIGLTYALTIAYAASLRFVDRHPWLVDLQLGGDALVVSAFVYITGGITSYFASLYVLLIVAGSAVRFRRGGLTIAALSAGLYGALVLEQYATGSGVLAEWLPDAVLILPAPAVARYTYVLNTSGFFAVAWLSGSLAEGVRAAGARLEQASDEIADLQALNQRVVDSLPSGLVTTDGTLRALTVNRAAEAITGASARSIIGKPISEALQVPADALEVLCSDSVGRPRRVEFQYRKPDSDIRIDVGMSAAPLKSPVGTSGFLFTFQDLTDFKKLERDVRLQQRLAAVGEMAAGIAHEIRNPLASMSGSIQILRHELPLTAEQGQLMDIVLRESERLNTTIRSFLEYARPQRFAIRRFDVRRALNDTALLLRNSAEVAQGHVVDVDAPASELWYEADENQIRQIVWNLATNGLRAMPSGGRLLLAARSDGATEGVVLTVQDEGVGIPAEGLDDLFQPFHGDFPKGAGLGLAIVHRIVTDYGGDIQVLSQPGEGTSVSVRLPARAVVTT